MTKNVVKAVATQKPLTTSELESYGFMDGYHPSSQWDDARDSYGTKLIYLVREYHYAKNWHEYHHCGIFVILHHCASQISIHDD